MSRTIQVSLPADKTDRLVEDLQRAQGVVGISLQRGASLKPPGDVLTVQATNEGLQNVLKLIHQHDIGKQASVLTSEPNSLVSPTSQGQIDQETNEATWPEMAAFLRQQTNISANYLMTMFFSGVIAAAGIWTDTIHIVVGAMVIAPGFAPIIRIPFAFLASWRKGWKRGFASTGIGYAVLMLGAALALLILMGLAPDQKSLGERPWVQYWTSIKGSAVLVSLAASAAGAAIIAAQRSVLTAGVMIALALVPSASILGMALLAGEFSLAGMALLRWAIDVGCVVVGGGLIFLVKHNVARRRGTSVRAGPPL